MTLKIIPAAVLAAMMATPARASGEWNTVCDLNQRVDFVPVEAWLNGYLTGYTIASNNPGLMRYKEYLSLIKGDLP